MAINSIANMMNNRLRVTGLSSGLDIDGMVEKLIQAESMKVDKYRQTKQVLEWKRDDYRSITNILRSFQDEYFSYTKTDTNMRSLSTLKSLKAAYDGADTSTALTVTPGSGARAGTYTIKNIVTAKTAKAEGSAISGGINGTGTPDFNISDLNSNNKVNVTLNGITKEITIDDGIGTIDDLIQNLDQKLDAAFGNGKITVGKTVGDELTFSTDKTNTLSFSYAYNGGYTDILGKTISSPLTLTSQNNTFKVTLSNVVDGVVQAGGNLQDIEIPEGTYNDADELVTAVQNAVNAKFGAGEIRVLNQNNRVVLKALGAAGSASGGVSGDNVSAGATIVAANKSMDVTINGVTKPIVLDEKAYTKNGLVSAIQAKLDKAFGAGKAMVGVDNLGNLRFEEVASDSALSFAQKENGGLDALKLDDANRTNKISMDSKILSISSSFAGTMNLADIDGDGYDVEFTINGEEFKFDAAETSLNNIINTVNNNAKANVKMQYDQMNDRIIVESKDTGVTAKVQISDTDGNIMGLLGLSGKNEHGTDASMVLNDGSGDNTITRSSNSFALNGINYDLKKDNAGPISVTVNTDTDKAVETIVKFVNQYNTVLDTINKKVSEKRLKTGGSSGDYYLPLTDEQKSAMNDSDVENWEKAAKTGLLYRDSMLESIAYNMRRAMSDAVKDIPGGLSSIGISSGTYETKGLLIVDQDKLKEALKNDPDKVINIFSKQSETSYSASSDAVTKKKRYDESGVASRLYDIMQDNIRTIRDSNGKKGALLEKAGMAGDLTDTGSLLAKEITDTNDLITNFEDKLATKREYYYLKFSAMESALSKMNSQSSWLSQQLGGG